MVEYSISVWNEYLLLIEVNQNIIGDSAGLVLSRTKLEMVYISEIWQIVQKVYVVDPPLDLKNPVTAISNNCEPLDSILSHAK